MKLGKIATLTSLVLLGTFTNVSLAAGDTLVVSTKLDPSSWDPIATFTVPWSTVATNVFEGLTYRGPDLKLVPGLATEWIVAEDGLSIGFKLREGVTFQNGEPFNAEAVKFTFERLLGASGAKGPQRSNYTAIERIEVIDDYSITMHLNSPDPVLLTKLAGYGAMIVPPKYITEKGEAHFASHPIGTGPYQIVNYEPKVDVKLKAYDNYWGEKAKIQDIQFKFIAEPATAVAELQAGTIDIVVDQIPLNTIKTIKSKDFLDVISVTGPTVMAFRFNTKSGITQNKDVRKALIMAVDRQKIIDTILAGQAQSIVGFQSALSFGYDETLEGLPFDPEKAKQMLAAAGVKPGEKIQIDYRANDQVLGQVVQALAGYLKRVGINVALKPYESSVYLNDIVPAGKTGEMFSQGWGGWTFDYDNTAYLMYHTGEKWNPYDSDPQLDKLLESQRPITDQKERERILKEISAYVANEALEMPLYNINTLYGINKRVQNFEPAPDQRIRLNNVTFK
ncbi:ABC transporter substrate-binding protein [Thorsellia kenyensis]|uniref:ABC transporter substrate-binding protein n=1 Tax=Thorsellia kenyensis TaxID=1549888 RepID=A0ABV6C8D8_9GAMM